MKKIISLILALALTAAFSTATAIAADTYITLNGLAHSTYLRGETVVVSGDANTYVSLSLFNPNGIRQYNNIYSPAELADGIEILIGTDESTWPYGTWRVYVSYGEDASDETEFELAEEREEEPETEKPTSKKNTSSGDNTVTGISLSPSELTIEAGESASVAITSAASSFTVEVGDDSIVSASVSGKTLTVKGLKRGTSAVWVRVSGNYAYLPVTVTYPTEVSTEAESETEAPTEKETEAPTEANTEEETKAESVSFTDTDSHWAKDDIYYLASLGVVSGFGDGTFAPEDKVTRAQFVTMLKNAFNIARTSDGEIFPDVKKTDWYYETVMAAYDAGITKGSDGKFNPSDNITRQDMTVFAYRALAVAGITPADGSSTGLFADDAAISDYAKSPVYSMRAMGIVNGMTDVTFEPLGNATRAQAATIIAKLIRSL